MKKIIINWCTCVLRLKKIYHQLRCWHWKKNTCIINWGIDTEKKVSIEVLTLWKKNIINGGIDTIDIEKKIIHGGINCEKKLSSIMSMEVLTLKNIIIWQALFIMSPVSKGSGNINGFMSKLSRHPSTACCPPQLCWRDNSKTTGVGVEEGYGHYWGDAGDICCHYWQHIVIFIPFDRKLWS